MKKLNTIIGLSSLLVMSSCIVSEKVTQIAEGINVDSDQTILNKVIEDSNTEKKDTINPVVIGTKFNILISKNTLKLVQSDLDSYTKSIGKISPNEFWENLSEAAHDAILFDLIRENNDIGTEEFEEKKKVLAYAFLYYLNGENETDSYKYIVDNRECDSFDETKEYISFAKTWGFNGVKEVEICGFFKFSNIETQSPYGFEPKILCTNKEGSNFSIKRSADDHLIIKKDSIRDNDYSFKYSNFKITSKNSRTNIKYKSRLLELPKMNLSILKRHYINEEGNKVYIPNSSSQMDLYIKTSFRKKADKFTNLSCRTINSFDFE